MILGYCSSNSRAFCTYWWNNCFSVCLWVKTDQKIVCWWTKRYRRINRLRIAALLKKVEQVKESVIGRCDFEWWRSMCEFVVAFFKQRSKVQILPPLRYIPKLLPFFIFRNSKIYTCFHFGWSWISIIGCRILVQQLPVMLKMNIIRLAGINSRYENYSPIQQQQKKRCA